MVSNARWLVTGASGLLGANAALDLSRTEHVVGVARSAPADSPVPFAGADIAVPSQRANLIDRLEADVVLHCAALATIEACEANPLAARELNVSASADLAAQASRAGAQFVYISTDAVFDGSRGNYAEADETSPTSEYGRTKREGELAVLDAHPGALIARVNFYGWSPSGQRSLAEFFVNRLTAGQETPGFTDVRVSTMYVGGLVDRIRRLVAMQAFGVYHVVNDESITKYEFGRRIANWVGADRALVRPTNSTEVVSVARGSDLTLNTDKMRARIGISSQQYSDLEALFKGKADGRREAVAAFNSRAHYEGAL